MFIKRIINKRLVHSRILEQLLLQIVMCLVFLQWAAVSADVVLKDGTVLKGSITRQTDSTITLQTSNIGTITVPTANIIQITEDQDTLAKLVNTSLLGQSKKGQGQRFKLRDPGDHSLLFMPTAFSPPKGTGLFKDFELLFLTWSYSPTTKTTLTFGALFPVSAECQNLTLGFKQQLLRDNSDRVALAIGGAISKPLGNCFDLEYYYVANSIVSARNSEGHGIHLALGAQGAREERNPYYYSYDNTPQKRDHHHFTYALGGELRLTENAKFIAEFFNYSPLATENNTYYFNVGIRFFGQRLFADISGLRPLEATGDLLFIPFVNFGYRFGARRSSHSI